MTNHRSIASHRASLAAILVLVATLATPPAASDVVRVTLDPAASSEPITGRLIVSFITEDGAGGSPLGLPFYSSPQPVGGIDITLAPGDEVAIQADRFDWYRPINRESGRVRVAAILDRDGTVSSRMEGPGNVYSRTVTTEIDWNERDEIMLVLDEVVSERRMPLAPPNLTWVSMRSESLSTFYGRDVFHRAGVAVPRGYDAPDRASRLWPTIYVIPGFGEREESAINYATMLAHVEPEFIPQAVWIVLDPDSPLGHHGLCDSENNGPRGTAFVREFIPELESRFRLDTRPESRVLYGHSSGGWSALHLQLTYPDAFGACWSSAPDPIDFSRFQYSNLYEDRNLYEFAPGNVTPSRRVVDFDGRDVVEMTVAAECTIERALDPRGRSGEQWDAWEAMWSPRDPETGDPRPMFDARTGEIDRSVAEAWRRHDIHARLVRGWDTLGPVMLGKVRLFCGEYDNFYLNRAVERVRRLVELRSAAGNHGEVPGYIEIIEFASHDSVIDLTTERMHLEMIEHIRSLSR